MVFAIQYKGKRAEDWDYVANSNIEYPSMLQTKQEAEHWKKELQESEPDLDFRIVELQEAI